jgi:nanoRNase/pAp phosphatase (c-di-AMP/oligoRNAs hydrolase)
MRFGSDTAHELAQGALFGAYWFLRADGVVQFGLRSTEDGIDVSEIAATYGGGGHKHAAGFQVPLKLLAEMIS